MDRVADTQIGIEVRTEARMQARGNILHQRGVSVCQGVLQSSRTVESMTMTIELPNLS